MVGSKRDALSDQVFEQSTLFVIKEEHDEENMLVTDDFLVEEDHTHDDETNVKSATFVLDSQIKMLSTAFNTDNNTNLRKNPSQNLDGSSKLFFKHTSLVEEMINNGKIKSLIDLCEKNPLI